MKDQNIIFRTDKETREQLQRICSFSGSNMSAVIRALISRECESLSGTVQVPNIKRVVFAQHADGTSEVDPQFQEGHK